MGSKRGDKHDAMVIAIDCGESMADEESSETSYFELGKEILDWIVSRKIFCSSKDKINIVTSSSDKSEDSNASGVRIFNEIYQKASFDHLKFIKNEVVLSEAGKSLGVPALVRSLNSMIEHIKENPDVIGRSLLLISKSFAEPSDEEARQFDHIKQTMNDLGISFTHIGGHEDDDSSGMKYLKSLIEEVDGTQIGFREVGSALEQFSHPTVSPRCFRKNFEIAPGVILPFSMFVKVTEAKTPLKKCLVDDLGNEFKRQTTFLHNNEEVTLKENQVYGFIFGRSKVVVDRDIETDFYNMHNFNEKEKGGSLKLIQFTPIDNILPSYLIGNSSYIFVPAFDKKTASKDMKHMKASASLISGMIEEKVVAICRYAPDASKHLSLMCLIPKRNEESGFHFQGVKIPFFEDWRSYTLPSFDSIGNFPNGAQLQLVDELIDSMDINQIQFDSKVIPNPHFQRECQMLKRKALDSTDEPPSKFLQRYLELNPILHENAKHIFEAFLDPSNRNGFALQPVIKKTSLNNAEIVPDPKNHLKAVEPEEKMEVDDPVAQKPENKLMKIVKKAMDGGPGAATELLLGLGIQMKLFDESSLNAVEYFLMVRTEFAKTERFNEFNAWLLGLQGNDDYHDFNQFMDRYSYPSLITYVENPKSSYDDLESQMYWSGILEDKKDIL